jgi:uncharacterized hydrophobic protein (TIGR00341 family)
VSGREITGPVVSLRLLEVNVPNEALDQFPGLLDEHDLLHCWISGPGDPGGLVRILLDSADTEAVSDVLVGRFGQQEGFRLALIKVEATVPAAPEPEPEPEPKAGDGQEDRDKKSPRRGLRRVSREELYTDIGQASRLSPVFIMMVVLSTIVAAVGLMRGDLAIVIGAMVIAPLLGPNIGLSLAAALGDRELALGALRAAGAGALVAAALAIVIGALAQIDPAVPAIAARTQPSVGDIALALASGAAGALAFTSGVPSVVVGVMVAVALLPPLVVAGLLVGAGLWQPALGALTLVLTNVTCVNLSAMGTFYLLDVRPRSWWEADRARRATRRAALAWVLLLLLLTALIYWGKFDIALPELPS